MIAYQRTRGWIARGVRWFAGILGAGLLLVLSLYGALLLFVIAVKELKGFRAWMRLFNKRTLNPATLKAAGQRGNIYSVVHHVGRRSGTAYTTPVAAALTSDGFVIPLPYGKDVDWCRNVLAAGRCTMESSGELFEVSEPETSDGFVIPLPYGKDVDWCRNVLAAGRCTMESSGELFEVSEPEVIDGATALALLRPPRGLLWRALGMHTAPFLRVRMLAGTQDPVLSAASPSQPVRHERAVGAALS